MHRSSVVIFLILWTYIYQNGVAQTADVCKLENGKTGSCVEIRKCSEALILIKEGHHPKLCGFHKITPIVCCEITENIRPPDNKPTIADQKCSEYNAIVPPVLTIIRTKRSTDMMASSQSSSNFAYKEPIIIDGVDAKPLEFPHMALLGYGTKDNIKWKCGGSLISQKFVITAAHCIKTRHGIVQVVSLGHHQLSNTTVYVQDFNVKSTYRHPNYTALKEYNDIALIELDGEVDIVRGIKPACLHTDRTIPDEQLIATGWGATEVGNDFTDVLQKVNLSLVEHNVCSRTYIPQRRLTEGLRDDSQICARGINTRGDTCQGDSGGPLQYKSDKSILYTIVGITSFGIKCGIVPGVYSRVSHYVPWIESIVWPIMD